MASNQVTTLLPQEFLPSLDLPNYVVMVFYLLVPCPPLANPVGGVVSIQGNLPGDEASYTCDDDRTLVGQPTRVCGGGGAWEGEPPVCECEFV